MKELKSISLELAEENSLCGNVTDGGFFLLPSLRKRERIRLSTGEAYPPCVTSREFRLVSLQYASMSNYSTIALTP